MEPIFIDLGYTDCGNGTEINYLQIKYGAEWSKENVYSFDLAYGCTMGYLTLFKSKADLINHMIGEREKFEELFPEHYQDYLDIIEKLKTIKH